MRMTAACRPHLLKAKNATITNSGSMVGVLPAFDFLAYSAAKAALNHMMLGLAHYFAKQVRINSVLIGTVLTPGYAEAGLDEKAQYALTHPNNLTGRAGSPQDVANAFLWLASPAGELGERADDSRVRRRHARPAEAGVGGPAVSRLSPRVHARGLVLSLLLDRRRAAGDGPGAVREPLGRADRRRRGSSC